MCIEPVLQPLDGERLSLATSNTEDNARADIRASGFLGNDHQCAFFDLKVFNPNAQANKKFSQEACYRHNEGSNKQIYKAKNNGS